MEKPLKVRVFGDRIDDGVGDIPCHNYKWSKKPPGRPKIKIYLNDLDVANAFLEAAVAMCVFRINRLCWQNCKAQDYCQPEQAGLKVVKDLKEAAI